MLPAAKPKMSKTRKPLLNNAFSIRTLLPNIVTLLAFIAGLTSIRFALSEKWELAVAAIVLAGILDGLDGTVARLLRSTSKFGAELDSLSDNVAFGVAPAVVLYLWTLDNLDRLGWSVALFYAVAMALRLARFNAGLEGLVDDKRKRLGYLTGIPAPAGAGLLLAPLMINFLVPELHIIDKPFITAGYIILISVLMVSSIPTPSMKSLRVRREFFVPLMLSIGALMGGIFVNSWVVLLVLSILYLISLPITYYHYRRRLKIKSWK